MPFFVLSGQRQRPPDWVRGRTRMPRALLDHFEIVGDGTAREQTLAWLLEFAHKAAARGRERLAGQQFSVHGGNRAARFAC